MLDNNVWFECFWQGYIFNTQTGNIKQFIRKTNKVYT